MKQHTNEIQTANLIELGFETPKQFIECPTFLDSRFAYSIGELMEFCPIEIRSPKFDYAIINIFHDGINWVVGYDDVCGVMRFITSDIELIDALCTICRKLKEEGVI